MPHSQFIPGLDDDVGDAPNPLMYRRRHLSRTTIRYTEPPGHIEPERATKLLRAHCSTRGRRHQFVVDSAEGKACLWCGKVRADA